MKGRGREKERKEKGKEGQEREERKGVWGRSKSRVSTTEKEV